MATLTASGGGKTITVKLLDGYSFPECLDGDFDSFRCWFIGEEESMLLRVEHDGERDDLVGVDWVSSSDDNNEVADGTMAQN